MKKGVIICLALVLVITCLALVACSNSTNKQDPVETTKSDTVESNGGMAVKYGNYIYFINGYSGVSTLNTYGDVTLGALCRVTLKDGKPDYTTTEMIASKNVYGEDTTNGGLYILGDYIYYPSTSLQKDSNREYKTSEGVLMRTKLDGSVTEQVLSFKDNGTVFYAGNNSNYLVYEVDNKLHLLDAKTAEVKDVLVSTAKNNEYASDVTAQDYKCVGDYVVYTTYNFANYSNRTNDLLVWLLNLKTGKQKVVMSSEIYNGNSDATTLFKTTLVDYRMTSDNKIFLLYKKEDNTLNGSNKGFYSYVIDPENPAFDSTKEVRYSNEITNTTYSNGYFLSNGYVVLYGSKVLYFYDTANNQFLQKPGAVSTDESQYRTITFSGDITIASVVENDSSVYMYYLNSDNQFMYIKLFNKDNNTFTFAEENVVKFFTGKFDSTYVKYDIINNIIYYLNDDKGDNAFYYVIPDLTTVDADTDVATGKLLGELTKEQIYSLIVTEDSSN